MRIPSSLRRPLLPLLLLLACLAGCSAGGPTIDPLEPQVVAVGSELILELKASNASGADIRFEYDSNATIDAERGGLTQRPGGRALFTWTPSAQDIGVWTIDFHAIDGSGKSTESITIEVKSAVGLDTLPVFRRPLGAGTALDLSRSDCVEVEIIVDDQDSLSVELSEQEPRIEGAELVQEEELRGVWRWCPSQAQRRAQERYMLSIAADDGESALALKHYQIILRDPPPPDCAGQAPKILHTAADQETLNGIAISAEVSDDLGVKGAVSLFYSQQRPSDPPDLGSMTLLPMELASGSVSQGTWTATIPNPVVDSPAGTEAELFYLIVADDNDDRGGKCDHSTLESFEMRVSNPGGEGGLGLCEPCTSDRQCGGESDLCLPVGAEATRSCFAACDGDAACPEGYSCSAQPIESAEGHKARQCIPDDQSCSALACEDDGEEQNDGITQPMAIEPGSMRDLRMCPFKLYAADEDWYEIRVEEDSEVTIEIEGEEDPNIDLRLLDEAGNLVAISEDFGSVDSLSRCLPAGTYYLRAYSYLFYPSYVGGELQDMGNSYSLSYTRTPSQCTASTCTDDAFEDDDALEQARVPDFGGLSDAEWRSTGNQMCAGDQDWYYISAYNNLNHISVSLSFEQSSAAEDLDILVYDGGGQLLTPCVEGDTSGCTSNGQSGDSNEYLSFQPPPECSLPVSCQDCAPCDYYLVVNGFGGAENEYDICIGYDSEDRCL